MTAAPTILVFDSGLGGLTVFREVASGAAGRPLRLCRRRRLLPLRPPGRGRAGRPRARRDGATDRGASAGPRGGRLQHRLDAGAAAAPREIQGPVRRHGPGDQAGMLEPRTASSCRCSAPKRRLSASTPARSSASTATAARVTLVGSPRLAELAEAELNGEPVDRRRHRGRDRALFRRGRRRAHRHRGAGLHALSAAARSPGTARALAGEFHRSGPGHRPPGGGSARAAGARRASPAGPRRFHLGPAARARACRGAGRVSALPRRAAAVFDTPGKYP